MAKIKTLNETVWERKATEPAINEWLDNFGHANASGVDERKHALYLLSNFMYFGSRQIRELLKALFRDLYRYPIVEAIRRAHGDTVESQVIDPLFRAEVDATRFLGMGNPSESGCHLLYYFRQENRLAKDHFIHTHEIFSRRNGGPTRTLRDRRVTRYVFIDDFCGSGKQGTEYSHEVVEEIKQLNPGAFVGYYAVFGTTQGMTKLRNETAFSEAKAVYELDDSFKCFSTDSRYFRENVDGVDKGDCERTCRKYGGTMVAAPHVLGFDDAQLLIGFHHNTPDNTLPIIWFDEPGGVPWKPIFRRYPKLGW
jgi:hypothetical protein